MRFCILFFVVVFYFIIRIVNSCLTSFVCRRRQSIYLLKYTDTIAYIYVNKYIRNLPNSLAIADVMCCDVIVVVVVTVYIYTCILCIWTETHSQTNIIIARLVHIIYTHFLPFRYSSSHTKIIILLLLNRIERVDFQRNSSTRMDYGKTHVDSSYMCEHIWIIFKIEEKNVFCRSICSIFFSGIFVVAVGQLFAQFMSCQLYPLPCCLYCNHKLQFARKLRSLDAI